MPTRTILNYEIEKKLGEGGMGEVYVARDTRLDRRVALKFLSPHLAGDTNARERLLREAKAASRISHPNILTIHEVGEDDDGNVYIAMQYVQGESLDTLIVRQALSTKRLLNIAIQICDGLRRAHEAGIIHRDVKPQNILIDAGDRVTILDFGLAKVFDHSKLTQTGATIGTMAYMSPEQVRGDLIDQRSDIFSLGVVLYEMVTGRNAFAGDNPAETLHAIAYENPEAPSRVNSDCGENLEQIVGRAMAKNVDERYPDVVSLRDDLQQELLLREYSSSDSIPAIRRPAGPKVRWMRLGITLSLVTAALVTFLVLNPLNLPLFDGQEALADKHSLAVMYFENIAEPDDADKTAEMATSLLITDLSESQYLNILSRQRLYDILGRIGKGDVASIDRSVATEVAQAAGVECVLTGSILQTTPNIVLISSIADAATGNILSSQRVTGEPGDDLFAVVDRLSAAIRTDMTLPSEAEAEFDRPVTSVTTASSEAYRYYVEGLDHLERMNVTAAIEPFERAVALDSTFAMAWYKLAHAQRQRMMFAPAMESIARAVRHGAGLSQRERLYIQSEQALAQSDIAGTVSALEELIAAYPDEIDALMTLGSIELSRGKFERAVVFMNRVIAIDPRWKLAWNYLAYAYHYLDDYERSLEAINRYVSLVPDEANPYDTRGDLHSMNGNLSEAIESYRAALERDPEFYHSLAKIGHMRLFERDYGGADSCYQAMFAMSNRDIRSEGRVYLSFTPLHRGQLKAALDILDEGIAADRMERVSGYFLLEKYHYKARVHANLGNWDEAFRNNAAAMEFVRTMPGSRGYWTRVQHAKLLTRTDQIDAARDSAKSLRADLEKHNPSRMDIYWYAMGWIARAEGNLDSAIVWFKRSVTSADMFSGEYALGMCYLEQGRLGEAVDQFQRLLKSYNQYRAGGAPDAIRAHYLLGQAYERSGWISDAIRQYTSFVECWKDADPELTEVEDARERLKRLMPQS